MSSALVSEIRPITLRDQIAEEVRRAIFEGRLRPGDRIREQALTEQLNVSRTPVREALIVLERDGLIVNHPNRGCSVRHYDEREIVDIFEMRAGLEILAGELIIRKNNLTREAVTYLENLIQQQRMTIEAGLKDDVLKGELNIDENALEQIGQLDREFHRYLVALADNRRLMQGWKTIAAQVTAVISYHSAVHYDYNHRQMVTDHRLILEALLSGNMARLADVHRQINDRVTELCIDGLHGE